METRINGASWPIPIEKRSCIPTKCKCCSLNQIIHKCRCPTQKATINVMHICMYMYNCLVYELHYNYVLGYSVLVKGSKIKSDPLANSNEKRRKFCQKYDGYIDFCDGEGNA